MMRRLVASAAMVFAGCAYTPQNEPPPELLWPKEYVRDGISFSYPRNWRVASDGALPDRVPGFSGIVVETGSNTTTFLTILKYEGTEPLTFEEFSSRFPGARGPVSARILGKTCRGVDIEHSVSVFGIPVPVRTRLFDLGSALGAPTFLTLRALRDDWEIAEEGFSTIMSSLLISDARDHEIDAGHSKREAPEGWSHEPTAGHEPLELERAQELCRQRVGPVSEPGFWAEVGRTAEIEKCLAELGWRKD